MKKLRSKLPGIFILLFLVLSLLISLDIIPHPSMLIEFLQVNFDQTYSIPILFTLILLESIIGLGFYFPGQILAVLTIIFSGGSLVDFIILTIICIIAVTLGAAINYYLGYYSSKEEKNNSKKINYKTLILSMIHINLLAIYLYQQGVNRTDKKIIYITGLLNLPYYLLLIVGAYVLQDQILSSTENPYYLLSLLLIWLAVSVFLDIRDYVRTKKATSGN